MVHAVRKQVAFNGAVKHAVTRLVGHDHAGRAVLVHLRRCTVRDADLADFALLAQRHQAGHRVLDRGFERFRRLRVRLHQVDAVGTEPAQAVLDLDAEGARLQAAAHRPAVLLKMQRAGVVAPPEAALGGDQGIIAPPRKRASDDLLAVAESINRRGVDQVDPGVQRGVDGAD